MAGIYSVSTSSALLALCNVILVLIVCREFIRFREISTLFCAREKVVFFRNIFKVYQLK